MKPEGGAGTAVKTARRIHGFLVILERAAGAAAKAAAATAAMAVAALLLVTASCATLPREAAAPDPLILLPPGKSVYGSLNVPDNREIAEALIGTVVSDPKLRASFLDRTNRVFIGGDLAGPEGTSLLPIAEGTYPRSLVSIGLAGSGDWRREKGKPDIWVK